MKQKQKHLVLKYFFFWKMLLLWRERSNRDFPSQKPPFWLVWQAEQTGLISATAILLFYLSPLSCYVLTDRIEVIFHQLVFCQRQGFYQLKKRYYTSSAQLPQKGQIAKKYNIFLKNALYCPIITNVIRVCFLAQTFVKYKHLLIAHLSYLEPLVNNPAIFLEVGRHINNKCSLLYVLLFPSPFFSCVYSQVNGKQKKNPPFYHTLLVSVSQLMYVGKYHKDLFKLS